MRRRVRAADAFPAEVSLAVMRRVLQDFEARLAASAAHSSEASTSTSTTSSTSSSPPSATPFPGGGTCIDQSRIVDVLNALDDPLLPRDFLLSDSFGSMSTRALEAGTRMEVLVDGQCQVLS